MGSVEMLVAVYVTLFSRLYGTFSLSVDCTV